MPNVYSGDSWSADENYPEYDDDYSTHQNKDDSQDSNNGGKPPAASTWGIENALTTDNPGLGNYPHTTYVNPRYSQPYSQERQKC